MKILNTLILLSLSLVEVTPSLLSIANSVMEWTTELGPQVPGVTPLFAKLSDGVALASIIQDNDNQFHLNVTTFDATGDRRTTCEVPLLALPARVWNIRLTYLGDSRVGLTCLINDKDKLETALRLVVVYLDNCVSNTVTVTVDKNVDYVYHISYSVVPYEGGEFDVFVKSPTVCERGICKIGFKTVGQQIVKNGKPISFADSVDNYLGWTILASEPFDASEGFYLIGVLKNEESNSEILKFRPDGELLIFLRNKPIDDGVLSYSNAYGNLGLCTSTLTDGAVGCALFDGKDLLEKVRVSVPVEARPVKKIGVANDKSGGLLLLLNTCLDEHCFEHVTTARKISAKGEVGDAVEFARSRAGCYPRSNYDLIVDEKEGVYCTGAPCMRKSANSTAYDVSAHIKCLKNV